MRPGDAIFVAGGAESILGRAIVRRLTKDGYSSVIAPSRAELALDDRRAVAAFFDREKPRFVIHAAGRSAGIEGNRRFPATLMIDNLAGQTNVFSCARAAGVEKLLYLASSCCYPRDARQPMHPRSLFTGPVEPTNAAYATAKLAGITLCRAIAEEDGLSFVSAIPANMFGPEDDFSEQESHVVGALIRRMHFAAAERAPSVTLWGTGAPRRELVHVDEIASAAIHVMKHYNESEPINLGGGADLSIAELAREIAAVVGFKGSIEFDSSRPDGMPRKLLDSTRLFELGWKPSIPFRQALVDTHEGFKSQLTVHA